jgi:LytS/YehU family sensor histidine kinase
MILQNSQSKLITLEQELESLELYLSLEALRFDNHFSYKINVQQGLGIAFLKVPPLIIQPYAENAVWHGLMHNEEKGQLDIDIFCENDHLYLKITDNGVGRERATALSDKTDTVHKSWGLGITSQRITMVQEGHSQESPVVINDLIDEKGIPAGTEVIIKLPMIYD